jgi:hypothetical protein
MEGLVVVCADVGSMAKRQSNFGWYSSAGAEGCYASEMVAHLAWLIAAQVPIALGFECPLFLPMRVDEKRLASARLGEGTKAWSANPGCGAMGTGLVQATWVLQQLRAVRGQQSAYLSWPDFQAAGRGIFFWEAFVSGSSKRDSHVADARHAVEAFLAALPDVERVNALPSEGPVLSLIGAALLRTEWSDDLNVLSQRVLVVKPGT